MDVSFIIVSWNVRDLLRSCLRSVISIQYSVFSVQSPLNTETIVVDNNSSDGTVEMLRAEFPDVRVIVNSENVGFTRGNNQALALAQGRYLFLLNPDTELRAGALQTLTDFAEAHPRVGIIGPQLYYGDGSPQSSRRRFPTLATAFFESTILQQWFPCNRVLTRYYMNDTNDDATQPVDWVNGAAMFVRRAVYDQIGGLDERFFMYSEELDWCYRAQQAGWEIFYLPTAQITHYEGKSSEQVVAQRDIYFHSSKVRFFRKYRGAFVAEILRAFLLATFAFQIARESVKWMLGHKRALRVARVRAYLQVLQSGLK
ncbi:N-acetylglucosaminyl-diphospho-decaprenol L-rhamnosyltransferase [Anaerolineae bacterium]|nr:N-acetylglucosaminyl-diphospho-decaprenol L-rhamnosyltransferase [Anaerolineae bacterium]